MLRLRTFGAVHVAGDDGSPLGGPAGQRRVLAFLALLAAAGDRGLSRDKIAGLLWPDVDGERARHSITQALYAARRALGADDLFVAGADIRLNAERLTSDVRELERALEQGDLERAATLYEGPFLDGFYLPGGRDFEEWASTQRARYEDRIVTVLDQLARRAEAAGDARAAVPWRKRAAEIRPLDSAVAVALMTALARGGDRAGALQHARVHATLLSGELGLEPDPAVTALVAQLRDPATAAVAPRHERAAIIVEPPGPSAPANRPRESPRLGSHAVDDARTLEPADVGAIAGPATEGVSPSATLSPAAAPAQGARARGPQRRWLWLGAIGVAFAGGAALVAVTSRRAPPPRPRPIETQLRQHVVVAPFRVTGASGSLAYLREGLVELLSTRLADDSTARSVDAGAVVSAWRAAGLVESSDVPREIVVRLAARLGAERVVVGSVVGTRTRAIVTASVVRVPGGDVVGEATVEGPADSLTALVDRLAARLLVQSAGEDESLADLTSTSLPALRRFLAGQAAFRRGAYVTALRAYEGALRLDSTFALAALQYVRAADRLEVTDDRSQQVLALAWTFRDALGDRDLALLSSFAGPHYPTPSAAGEQLASWQRPADLTPDRAESWYELGARLFHAGATAGVPNVAQAAASAARRALALDSTHVPARRLLEQLTFASAPAPAAGVGPAASAARRSPDDTAGALAAYVGWRTASVANDDAALRRLRGSLSRLPRSDLRAVALASQFDVASLGEAGLADAALAVRALRERAARPSERIDAALAEHSLALNEGRLADARAAGDQLRQLQPAARAHLRLRVLDAIYGGASEDAPAVRELAAYAAAPPSAHSATRAVQLADGCVLAQWRLFRNDTTDVRRIIGGLRAARLQTVVLPVAAPPAVCAELLDAAFSVVAGRPDARAALARLDALAFTPSVSGDATAYAPLLAARLHERLGDLPGALAAVRKRARMVGWPRYLAAAWREEGRLSAATGAMGDARNAYARYLALRARADEELGPEVRGLRDALGRMAPR